MDLSNLTYSKGNAEKTPFKPEPKTTTGSYEDIGGRSEALNVSPAYSKADGVLSTSLVFVLSGGEKREKDFLRELIRQRELHSLRVAFMSEKGQGLQPYQMHEMAQYLLDTMNKNADEYLEFVRRKEEWRKISPRGLRP